MINDVPWLGIARLFSFLAVKTKKKNPSYHYIIQKLKLRRNEYMR